VEKIGVQLVIIPAAISLAGPIEPSGLAPAVEVVPLASEMALLVSLAGRDLHKKVVFFLRLELQDYPVEDDIFNAGDVGHA